MESSVNQKTRRMRTVLIPLALMLFDIFAVNISYFGALLMRFYVASEFNIWAVKYVPAFTRFAPYYTIACLVVFWVFRMYNNRWRYAGLHTLNRIVAACMVTTVIQVVGSVFFLVRMPITYYVIGTVVQFMLIVFSRFFYRFIIVERERIRKLRKDTSIHVMIVGVGETSHVVLKHLERDTDHAAKTVCLLDYRGGEFGNMLEGIPVVSGIDKLAAAVQKYEVECVLLADTLMPQNIRDQIRRTCQEIGVDIQDFSGFFQDFRGAVPLRNLMEYTKGPVELVINGKRQEFADGEQAMFSLTGRYLVSTVSARGDRLVVELQKDLLVPNDVKEEWVHHYEAQTGEEISFF